MQIEPLLEIYVVSVTENIPGVAPENLPDSDQDW